MKRPQTLARMSRCTDSFGCRYRNTSLPCALLSEEIEHEADVAVVGVELRLV
jgi:hypothetical protein